MSAWRRERKAGDRLRPRKPLDFEERGLAIVSTVPAASSTTAEVALFLFGASTNTEEGT